MPDIIEAPKDHVIVPLSSFEARKLEPVDYPEDGHYGYIPESTNRGLASARKYLQQSQERVGTLNRMREHPDPRNPVAFTFDELSKTGAKSKAENQRGYDAVVKTLNEEISQNETHINAMGGFADNPNAAELRSVVRAMKQQERQALIGEAVERLDEGLLAALFGKDVHPVLLGVTAEFQAAHWNRYLQKIVPDYLKLREQLAAAKARLEIARPSIMETFDKASAGVEQFADAIAVSEEARKGITK